ncbi:homoserine dehydrogenase [Campylobacter sp. TTU-622]|uniref:homoserine dehydrogenase n=1 Tax=unclassified Campylobacter TaxID=2593542 RepID=UPI0019083958|nr:MULTISPECIES: homoserine dehydrogenase [unclassified Campylobacter]MBK1971913.1 homoserine dehydrogenase [Campylobacter sp. TTU_617]MBK1973677.1 homoserine dehydrogenase [Campylobacter sp. TTU-622]MBK1991544.1 homoserine dehydrogenase [Campylobacter sp. 2018MI34]
MRVAILGYGTVGSNVAKVLIENKKIIKARCGQSITPVIALARHIKKDALIPITLDVDEILNFKDIDVYVELMGGIKQPFEIISELLKRKKNVVTANKALLAYHRYELERLAKDLAFGYEASVAGGIPIIKVLKEGLSANNIINIKGILNGTCNYILTCMQQVGMDFNSALEKAQELGYAEADPSFDIEGQDATHKLLILASLAYNLDIKPEEILTQGIKDISSEDMYFANEFDFTIKLLGIAKLKDSNIELRVHPTMISKNKMLSKVDGVMNAISIVGDVLGESLYYGAGAGGLATASAIVADLMDIAKGNFKTPMLGFKEKLEFNLLKPEEIYTKYYLRIKVEDKLGVLSKITLLMSQNLISIESFLQKPKKNNENCTTIFFTTHFTYEKSIQNLLKILKQQEFVKEEPFMMRIED